MIPKKRHILRYILIEFGILNICVFLVLILKTPDIFLRPLETLLFEDLIPLFSIFNVGWGLVVLNIGNPNYYINFPFRKKLNYAIMHAFIFIGLVSTMAILFKLTQFNRTIILLPIFIFSILSILCFSIISKWKKNNTIPQESLNILLVGNNGKFSNAVSFANNMESYGYRTVGFLNNDKDQRLASSNSQYNILGKVKDLPTVLDSKTVDEIFISSTSVSEDEIQDLIQIADSRGVRVNIIPDQPVIDGNQFQSYDLNGFPVFKHRNTPLDNFNNFLLKRIFDTAFSIAVLIFLSPLFLLIAFLIKIDSRGPVFYKPIRKGEANETFRCYKFRTMSICDDPINGKKSTIKDDPRITRIGKYLRKYDLDELPQFYNVFKGEMSVVGPRPHRINLQDDFRKIVNDYMVRHYVRPGITGWAQVNGWRGPTETAKQKKERIRFDLWYIENWSFLLDIKIIFLTVFSEKTRKNAF